MSNKLITITKEDFNEASKKAMSELMGEMSKEDGGETSSMMIGLSSVVCYSKLAAILFSEEKAEVAE